MKAVVLCLVVLFAVAYGEMCRNQDNCHLTSCQSGSPVCIHHQCTCGSSSGSQCTSRDDCMSDCKDSHRDYHCVDGKCMCRH